MEISHTFAQRNMIPLEMQKGFGRKKVESFAYKQNNPKNSLMIDVNIPTQRLLAPLHPRTTKGQVKEIHNTLNPNQRHQTKVERISISNNPTRNKILFANEEENLIPHFEIRPQLPDKFARPNNFHLPKIKEGPKSFPIYRRPRNANRSLDYGYDNSFLVDESVFNRGSQIDKIDKEIAFGETKAKRVNKDIDFIQPPKVSLKNKENKKAKEREPTQETHRTLTSAFNSEESLFDPFGDENLQQANGDSSKLIKNVVENHVDKAYRKIGLMKRNFHRRNQSYWFHNQSNL